MDWGSIHSGIGEQAMKRTKKQQEQWERNEKALLDKILEKQEIWDKARANVKAKMKRRAKAKAARKAKRK